MTNIQQVNIWVEAETFLDSISDADIALRILAATEAAERTDERARPWSRRAPRTLRCGSVAGVTPS